MKRTIYFMLMSVLIGTIVGVIVVDVVNILYPDVGISYQLGIGFFVILTWVVLSLCGMVFGRAEPSRSR